MKIQLQNWYFSAYFWHKHINHKKNLPEMYLQIEYYQL